MSEEPKKTDDSKETGAPEKKRVRVVGRRNIAQEEAQFSEEVNAFRYAIFTMTPVIFITKILVALNVLYFIFMVVKGVHPMSPQTGQVVDYGANFGPLTLGGEWWRLVSCTFIHIGVFHLLFNMWVLWDIGQLVERLVGPVGFFFLYMLSGIGGSLASVAWNPQVVSAGASGAVFGVLGAMLGFVALRRDTIPKAILTSLRNTGLLFFGINFVFGMSIKVIDQAAHMGGFGVGLLCGLILSQPISLDPKVRENRAFRNGLMAVVASLLMIGAGALFVMPQTAKADSFKFFTQGLKQVIAADASLSVVNKRQQAKKLGSDAYAKQLETKVLPGWKRAGETLGRVKAEDLTKHKRKIHALLSKYAKLRRESLELWIKGVREKNPKLQQASLMRKAKASPLVVQIEGLLKSKAR